jgi:hypothetical protein
MVRSRLRMFSSSSTTRIRLDINPSGRDSRAVVGILASSQGRVSSPQTPLAAQARNLPAPYANARNWLSA